jgi:hypothetical protein
MSIPVRYSRLVLHGAFSRFSWGRDLLVALAINCASVFLSHRFGLISEDEWKSHEWLFVIAVVLPYGAIFIPHVFWRLFKSASDLHANQDSLIASLQTERTRSDERLRELEESGPKIVLCDPGAWHVETIQLARDGVVQVTAQFVKVRFVNTPKLNTPKAIARGVRAKIKFFNTNGELVLQMDGRWDDTKQPGIERFGESTSDLLPVDFGIQEARNLDIALWDPRFDSFVAWNNDNYAFQNFVKPEHNLRGDKFSVEIRLVGVHVDETFSNAFGASGPRRVVTILK